MKWLISLILATMLSSIVRADSISMYLEGDTVKYAIDTSTIMIKWKAGSGTDNWDNQLEAHPHIAIPIEEEFFQNFSLHPTQGTFNYDSVFLALLADTNIERACQVLIAAADTLSDTVKIYIGDEIICRFSESLSENYIDSLFEANNLHVISQSSIVSNQYTIKLLPSCTLSTLEASNLIASMSETIWSQPNYGGGISLEGYLVHDEYYISSGWNIKKTVNHINSANYGAWEITRGSSGISIAVLDQGIESHDDILFSNYEYGYDFVYGDGDPSPVDPEHPDTLDAHGMAVLGLINARHNNVIPQDPPTDKSEGDYASVAGIAPDCHFLALRMISYAGTISPPLPLQTVADAIDSATSWGADILNCSWSFRNQNPLVIRDAFNRAMFQGRNGKGCIVVASMGNNPLFTHFPALLDSVVSVGAIGYDDYHLTYSSSRNYIDLVAPSSYGLIKGPGGINILDTNNTFRTVDRPDILGYNPNQWGSCPPANNVDYTCSFSGTSASAPLVSGVVGLLLSVDSNLTRDQVQKILRASAIKSLDWGTIDSATQFTAYGYGRVSGVRALSSVMRGDMNGVRGISVADLTYLVQYLFNGGPTPFPDVLFGDANCSKTVTIADITVLVNYLYNGQPPPQKPCYAF